LQGDVGILQAGASLIFREQALVDGFSVEVVDQVGDAGKVKIKADCGLRVCCKPLFCAALDALFTQSILFAQAFSGGLWEWWEIKASEQAFWVILQIPSIAQLFFRKLFSDQPPLPQLLCRLSTFPT